MNRIFEILSTTRSLLTPLLDSTSSLLYLPLLPIVLQQILRNQLNHEYYVQRSYWDHEYDYIVIGAGSAGSVMAARLSEDVGASVLLLEAGMPENFVTDVPLSAIILERTAMDWSFETEPEKKANRGMIGRRGFWARGKIMGGSSTLNAMVYMRGNSRDFDDWEKNGATNWSWPYVFPYFVKAEDNRNEQLVESGYHGRGGPLTVSSATAPRKVSYAFQEAGPNLGYPIGDPNGANQSRFTIPQRTIRDGMRCSVAKAYLEPLYDRRNLHILIESLVTRILFDDKKRAIGVEFERGSSKYAVFARKEVVLSAGAINSPKILMLSGIGPKDHLREFRIPVISDLPVGDNLQEHYLSGMSFTVNESIGINVLHEVAPGNIFEYFLFKNNSLTNNLVEGTGFYKTKYANQTDDFPDVQLYMIPASLATDYGSVVRKVQGMSEYVWEQVFKPYIGLNSFAIYPMVLRPYSRGWIRLNSIDPREQPSIVGNIYDDERDLDIVVEGMKFALEIARTPSFQRYNAQPFETVFPGCEGMELYSDEYLRCQAKTYTTISWHPAGTVKMGAESDPTTVVDPFLRVKGVKSLRVVDASIMPIVVSGNLNAPTVMIAEKAADYMRGRRLPPIIPPMSSQMISRLPYMEYEVFGT